MALVEAVLAAYAFAQDAEKPRNWFDDPFFRVSSAVANCPEPLGPRVTEHQRLAQSHHRSERGTRCWLQGQCERPNAYEYDRDIAQRLASAWRAHPEFARTSIWVTVQGRVVHLEGCVHDPALAGRLEAFARSIPEVQQALASVFRPGKGKAPYAIWAGDRGGGQ